MRKTKVICPKCSGIIPGEVSAICYDRKLKEVYYAYCTKCDYEITESEWDEVEILPFFPLDNE